MYIYTYDIPQELRNSFIKKLNLNGPIIYALIMMSFLTSIIMLIITILLSSKEAPIGFFVMIGGLISIIVSLKRRNRIVKDILNTNSIDIDSSNIIFKQDNKIIKSWGKKHIKIIEQLNDVIYLSYLKEDGIIDKMAIPLIKEGRGLKNFKYFIDTI